MNDSKLKELAERVKREIKLEDLLSNSSKTNKREQTGYNCPFCGSGTGEHKTGAVQIFSDTNKGKCYSCGQSFDVLNVLALYKGYEDTKGDGFTAAVKEGCRRLSIDFDTGFRRGKALAWGDEITDDYTPHQSDNKLVQRAPIRKDEKDSAEQVTTPPLADFESYYKECSARLNNPACIDYLTRRGISILTAQKLRLGYDPAADPMNAPPNSGKTAKYPTPRVVIPYTSYYYTARATVANEYRYANPKGYPVDVFGKDALTGDQSVIFIFEGALDAVSVREVGKASVGLGGHVHYKKLLDAIDALEAEYKFTPKKFIVCLDNDVDNETARVNVDKSRTALADGLRARGCDVVIADICEGRHNVIDKKDVCKDANDFLIADKAGFIARLEDLANMTPTEDSPVKGDFIDGFLSRVKSEVYRPVSTGISWFDRLIGDGFLKHSFCILSASPGAGKSSLCLQISEALARQGQRVVYQCLEMDRDSLFAKVLSLRLGRWGKHYSATDILQSYRWDADSEQAKDLKAEISRYRADIGDRIIFNPEPEELNMRTVEGLRTYLDKLGKEANEKNEPAPFYVLDYLHLIGGAGLDPAEAVKQTCEVLSDYARKNDTIALGISAVNRGSSSGQIRLDSGRDTSNLEYAADLYLSLNLWLIDQGVITPNTLVSIPGKDESTYLDALYLIQNETYRRMVLRVLKGRLTPPGSTAKIYFDTKISQFLVKEQLGYNSSYGKDTALPFDRSLPGGARIINGRGSGTGDPAKPAAENIETKNAKNTKETKAQQPKEVNLPL